ncbi:MAG TPA: hypothetical protein VLC48_04385 [Gemmatimonadota bacterium]|nr:hypothetical protein [Gemmatimonadota bacterium]
MGRRRVVSACVVALTACADTRSEVDEVTVRDSAGIRIVTNPESVSDLPRWEIAPEPSVEIGGGETTAHQLYSVVGAVRLGDGRIVVADGGSSELRFYDDVGRHLRSSGRAGEGPGEFRRMMGLGRVRGDSLVVYDVGLQRLQVFDPEGEYVRGYRPEAGAEIPLGAVRDVFEDGSLLVQRFLTGADIAAGRVWNRVEMHRFSSSGEYIGGLLPTGGSEAYIEPDDDGGFWFTRPLFAGRSEIVVAALKLYAASTTSPEVQVWSADGQLGLLIRRSGEPRRVTDGDRSLQAEELLEASDPRERERMVSAFARMSVPDVMPAFGRLTVDDAANVWVEDYRVTESEASHWFVYGPDGRLRAEADWPAGVEPYHVGADFLLGLWRDDLDAEHVRLYRIMKP